MKNQSGFSFLGLLAIVLIGLKLAGVGVVADWSWWWVLSPLWMPTVFFFAFASVFWVSYLVLKAWKRR